MVRCIELGATDYLTKPINPRILAARLNASLAAKRLHDLELEHFAQQRAHDRDHRAAEGGAEPIPVAPDLGPDLVGRGRADARRAIGA